MSNTPRLTPLIDALELAMLNLEKHKIVTTVAISHESETKTTCVRTSIVLKKANMDYLESCAAAEQASKEMVACMIELETLQKEVDQLVKQNNESKKHRTLLRLTPLNAHKYIGYEILFNTRGNQVVKKILGVTNTSIKIDHPDLHNQLQIVSRKVFVIIK